MAQDFADFGSEISSLRRRLRAASGVRVHDAFPDYGKDFRRRLGIESEQAMELFHQTVSMKSVGNLTDFVRDHMLEPFDAAKAVSDIVNHFEDLTKAHDAVRRAEAQFDGADPAAQGLRLPRRRLGGNRGARRSAGGAEVLLRRSQGQTDRRGSSTRFSTERARLHARRADLEATLVRLRDREMNLRVELAGHGGAGSAEIGRQLAECDEARRSRMDKAERFAALLAAADLDPVQTAEQFGVRRRETTAALRRRPTGSRRSPERPDRDRRAGESLGGRGHRGQRGVAQPAGA